MSTSQEEVRFSPAWYEAQPIASIPWYGRAFDAVFNAVEWMTRPFDRFASHG